jgi:hypothetical protein
MIHTMLIRKLRSGRRHRDRIAALGRCARLSVGVAGIFAVLLSGAWMAHAQRLGQKVSTASGNVIAVYSISWPGPMNSVSAEVEICAGPNAPANTFAFPSFFQVHFADGGAIGSYGSRKQPTLERTPLKPGQCARGWLDFAVTSGQKPTVIRYHEMSADKKVLEWPVK